MAHLCLSGNQFFMNTYVGMTSHVGMTFWDCKMNLRPTSILTGWGEAGEQVQLKEAAAVP